MSIKSSIEMTFGRKNQDDFSITQLNSDGSKKYSCTEHWHDCYELIYVKNGRFRATIASESVVIAAGQIAVIAPYCLHSTETLIGENVNGIVFGYTESMIYSSDISFSNMKYLVPFRNLRSAADCLLSGDTPQFERLRELLEKGALEYLGSSPTRELVMRCTILEVHAILYEHFMFAGRSSGEELSQRYIRDAAQYIEANLQRDISPYEVAGELHLSYSHLSRVFRNVLGITISEFICRMRINLAEQLLINNSTLTVTECAISSGFSNTSYFIKQFHRLKGLSPGRFRAFLSSDEYVRL